MQSTIRSQAPSNASVIHRWFRMFALALSTVFVLQTLPAAGDAAQAARPCTLIGKAVESVTGRGYYAMVIDLESGGAVAVVIDEKTQEPRLYTNRKEAQQAANDLAAYLCGEGPARPGDPPPYLPLPVPPEV